MRALAAEKFGRACTRPITTTLLIIQESAARFKLDSSSDIDGFDNSDRHSTK
jgi:hypothetical protein